MYTETCDFIKSIMSRIELKEEAIPGTYIYHENIYKLINIIYRLGQDDTRVSLDA